MSKKLNSIINRIPWIWACLGSLFCWIAICVISGHLDFESLLVNASLASLLAIVSFGQMFAMTSGNGGIDLSIPYVITLSAFMSFGLYQTFNNFFMVLLIVAATGIVIGFLNAVAIIVFEIPPIIATMAVGYIVSSAVLVYATGFRSSITSKVFLTVASGRVFGIPVLLLFMLLLLVIIAIVFYKMSYGRSLTAVGQNKMAAYFAGIKTNKAIMIAYMISGLLAAIGGILLGARVDGAFLDMGSSYLMSSVGAVVVGGTLVSGGKASVVGTPFGALFLTLVVTLMVISHFPVGTQYIVEGLILIVVLSIGGNQNAID